jgi:hypothetical protein
MLQEKLEISMFSVSVPFLTKSGTPYKESLMKMKNKNSHLLAFDNMICLWNYYVS